MAEKEPVYTFKSVEKEEKTGQEIEKALVEEVVDDADKVEAERIASEKEAEIEDKIELSDADFISYLKTKHGKEVDSIESLLTPKEEKRILPEDVESYLKYKEETGRGLTDFLRVNEDIEGLSDDKKLARYYKLTQKGLDDSDIKDLMDEQFGFDQELDEVGDINRKKREKKKEISKANEYLADQRSKYKTALESKGVISKEDQEGVAAYKKYIGESKTNQEAAKKKGDWFEKKTDEIFTDEFKGFEFKVGEDKPITYTPSDMTKTKNSQKNIGNFIGKFLDEDGMMKDASGYHTALYMAENPNEMAKFFYEAGAASNAEQSAMDAKNITHGKHKKPDVIDKGGTKVTAVSNNSGRGLKIKKRT